MNDATPQFDEATIAGVTSHMNGDHPEDTLLICRGLGERPTASAATMTGLDGDAGTYEVTVDGVTEVLRIPWTQRLHERREVRTEVVKLYEAACAAMGVEPRPH